MAPKAKICWCCRCECKPKAYRKLESDSPYIPLMMEVYEQDLCIPVCVCGTCFCKLNTLKKLSWEIDNKLAILRARRKEVIQSLRAQHDHANEEENQYATLNSTPINIKRRLSETSDDGDEGKKKLCIEEHNLPTGKKDFGVQVSLNVANSVSLDDERDVVTCSVTYAKSRRTVVCNIDDKHEQSMIKAIVHKRSIPQIVRAIWRVTPYKSELLPLFLKDLDHEAQNLCSTASPSYLRFITPDDLQSTDWSQLIQEWKERAPNLYQVLQEIAVPHQKRTSDAPSPPVCVAGSILLHCRNQQMSRLQYVHSLLLNQGGIPDRRIGLLHDHGLCVSSVALFRKRKQLKEKLADEKMSVETFTKRLEQRMRAQSILKMNSHEEGTAANSHEDGTVSSTSLQSSMDTYDQLQSITSAIKSEDDQSESFDDTSSSSVISGSVSKTPFQIITSAIKSEAEHSESFDDTSPSSAILGRKPNKHSDDMMHADTFTQTVEQVKGTQSGLKVESYERETVSSFVLQSSVETCNKPQCLLSVIKTEKDDSEYHDDTSYCTGEKSKKRLDEMMDADSFTQMAEHVKAAQPVLKMYSPEEGTISSSSPPSSVETCSILQRITSAIKTEVDETNALEETSYWSG